MEWIQGGKTRKYTFDYDGLSRLKTASFALGSMPGVISWVERYSTSYFYDKNGNATGIRRYRTAVVVNPGDPYCDDLTLNYGGSNQLKDVSDAGAAELSNPSYGFKDYSSGTDEYAYNANGSMTKDLNSGISDIAYSVLNMPVKVDVKSPVAEARNEYTYSADGRKLKVVHKWASVYSTVPVIGSAVNTSSLNNTKTTDYAGNFIYENNALKRILTDNGYYEGEMYYFYVKNHLGSNVLVADRNGGIVQENHYFPFGMSIGGLSSNPGAQPYKYTGKELDMQHGLMVYDYGARTYDPAGCRFWTMDPLAEKYPWISPYAYCNNNPVNNIDPTGMDWYRHDESGAVIWQESNNSSITIKDQIYSNIGETYSHTIGNSTYGYTQHDLTSITYTGITDNNWVSQITNNMNCYQASSQMLSNVGVSTAGKGYEVIIVNQGENGRAGTGNNNLNTGISVINNALEDGNPIIVGVDYRNGSPNADGMTDHFIVISSMTHNINNGNVTRTTYNFFDPGTQYSAWGTSPNNNLSFSNNQIIGTYVNKLAQPYTVVTVRRNR
jgi:RHS repeat-associated protein